MPRAAPSSRVASFIAEPIPARRAGTADMIDAVDGDIASAMPHENGTKQQMMNQYSVCNPRRESSSSPHPSDTIPAATVRLAPKRFVMRGVNSDMTSRIIAIGSRRAAALSGL